jgi:prepilin-type N-terminal cleavage/methylation domain-containing protein
MTIIRRIDAHQSSPSVCTSAVRASAPHPAARRPAFTLLELIVVIILLAVVAAVIAPRLAGSPARDAERALERIADLLCVAAHRDSVGGRHAIAFDPAAGSFVIESLRPDTTGGRAWRPDPFLPPARLNPLTLRAILLDGSPIYPDPDGRWRIEFPEHEPRPLIEMRFESVDGAASHPLRLLPGAVRVEPRSVASREAPIDLDAQGTGHSAW